jgi:hypothetical protein
VNNLEKRISYNEKYFVSVSNTENGEVSDKTRFHYRQDNDIVWAEYSGGEIVKGFLIGKADEKGRLEFAYQHINTRTEIRIGTCLSLPEQLPDGRLRLVESWKWLNGDESTGSSIIEEVEAL